MARFVGTLGFLALVQIGFSQQSQLEADVLAGRKALPPFAAEYSERVTVAHPKSAPRGAVSWGNKDSVRRCEASVDAGSSELYIEPSGTDTQPEGDERYFTDGRRYYTAMSAGSQGNFGAHPSGMLNPAAFGVEMFSMPLADYFARTHPSQLGEDQLYVSEPGGSRYILSFARPEGRPLLEAVNGGLMDKFRLVARVTAWTKWHEASYPSSITMQIYKEGELSQTREYTLLRMLPDKAKPIAWRWNEGATVKDTNTNQVFVVKGGRLIPDFRSNPTFAATLTWNRAVFIVCILGAGIWGLLRARRAVIKKVAA